jgi:hypothetical protein
MTRQHRSTAIAGIVFGLLTPISIVMMLDVPTQKGPIEAWSAHLASADDRAGMATGWLVMCVAVLSLGWWLIGLAAQLATSPAARQRDAALVSGAIVGGLLLVATTVMFSIYGTIWIGGAAVPSGELGLHTWYLGFWLLLTPVSVAGAFFMTMTATAGAGLLPSWLRVVGWLGAPVLLTASFIVVTLAVLPLFVLLTGVTMLFGTTGRSSHPNRSVSSRPADAVEAPALASATGDQG